MRPALSTLLVLTASFALVRVTAAQEPVDANRSLFPFQALVCPDKLLRACCDFYCSKPQPCIGCSSSAYGECYCGKPQPCIPCYGGGYAAHCYCPKPCPSLCRPIAADYFRCVDRDADCMDCHPSRAHATCPGGPSHVDYCDPSDMDASSIPTPPPSK